MSICMIKNSNFREILVLQSFMLHVLLSLRPCMFKIIEELKVFPHIIFYVEKVIQILFKIVSVLLCTFILLGFYI